VEEVEQPEVGGLTLELAAGLVVAAEGVAGLEPTMERAASEAVGACHLFDRVAFEQAVKDSELLRIELGKVIASW
jgi:hypothetical protein